MQRSLVKRIGYRICQTLSRVVGLLFFRLRVVGREKVPTTGGGLVCANHQSYFDPVLVGAAFDRRLNFLARETLFRIPLLNRLIAFLDSIPIDREGSGLAGLKETLRRLKRDELVLIFPEGTRSRDGELQRLKGGFISIARRSRQPLIPVGLDGAFQAWPRTQRFPRLSSIAVVIGDPILPEELGQFSDAELLAELDRRVQSCFAEARQIRSRRKSRPHESFIA